MLELCFLLVGMIIGSVVSILLTNHKTADGFFKVEKMPDEDDLYTINMRLVADQDLNKKTRIILTRE